MKKTFFTISAFMVVILASFILISGKNGKLTCIQPRSYTGAPPGVSDDPANSNLTCNQSGCHNSFSTFQRKDVGIILLSSTNIPRYGYTPDTTYTITASVVSANLFTFGFENTVEDSLGTKMQGTIIVTDNTNTQLTSPAFLVIHSDTFRYITHTSQGTNYKSWTYNWKAPAKGSGTAFIYQAYNLSPHNPSAGDYGPQDDSIFTSICRIPENVNDSMPAKTKTGIATVANPQLQVTVYPTVSNGQFSVAIGNGNIGNVYTMEIYNMKGEKVYQSQISNLKSQISLNAPDGEYFVGLRTENASTFKKIIIIH